MSDTTKPALPEPVALIDPRAHHDCKSAGKPHEDAGRIGRIVSRDGKGHAIAGVIMNNSFRNMAARALEDAWRDSAPFAPSMAQLERRMRPIVDEMSREPAEAIAAWVRETWANRSAERMVMAMYKRRNQPRKETHMNGGTATLLRAIHEALMDRADTYDGTDGTPRPNDAMLLLNEFGDRIEAAIAAERERDDAKLIAAMMLREFGFLTKEA